MRLYAGSSMDFINDSVYNRIADKLTESFFKHFRFNPPHSEINAWRNSLRAVSQVFDNAGLTDHGVILEYQLPLTSMRLDCLICGKDKQARDNAVIIELKQWDHCSPSDGENLVRTWIGGDNRDILHPSAQVGQYHYYVEDNHTAFHSEIDPIKLSSCAYLHNYSPIAGDVLFSDQFKKILTNFPTFSAEDVEKLKEFLVHRLNAGEGIPILRRIEKSKYRPSKKLMEHVGNVIKGKPEYVLLDNQLVVYDKVVACARRGFQDSKKAVLIIKGGPGTGKSVVAINLMSDLLLSGYNAHYATGSRAFTSTLRKVIGSRGQIQFKYFNSYANAEFNVIDVLICDEAHRIRESSNSRFMRAEQRSDIPQIEELIQASKVCVFFIDDRQIVRPNEIGSVSYIKEYAEKNNCRIFEYQLEAQFRCAGSDGFVNWVNNTLGIERTANVLWDPDDSFDFQIIESPESLESAIYQKVNEGFSARLSAGFCWQWSQRPNPDGTLIDDVKIGNYKRPWNARPDATKLAHGIPKADYWAYDPNGINQIGCIYTAQGFEFDYIGVIFGNDLVYDFNQQDWIGQKEYSHDIVVKRSGDKFLELVKNTYRVLLSRGLKGCYVHFMDKDTGRFVKSRIDRASMFSGVIEKTIGEHEADKNTPFKIIPDEEARPFENCVPLLDLKIAASGFSEEQQIEGCQWVALLEPFRHSKGLFVAQVIGESMNKRVPNGAWALFRLNPVGSRNGKTVLAQHRDIHDVESGGHFTLKVYQSEKEKTPNGGWRHTQIILSPDSYDHDFEPIIISEDRVEELKIVAEMVAVLV